MRRSLTSILITCISGNQTPTVGTPSAVDQPDAVHLTYETDSPDSFAPNGFEDGVASIVTDAPDTGSSAVHFFKGTDVKAWAGVTLAEEAQGVQLITADHPTVTLHVYAAEAGIPMMMQLKDTQANLQAEVSVDTAKAGWQTMVYDFAAFVDSGLNYNQMSMFPDFVQPTDADQDFYFDDIRFLDAVAGTTDPVITEPPVNTAPVFADATVVVDVDENETAVYVAQATDAEDTVSYTLGGDDAAAFEIAADGTVTFKVAPDYEVDPQSYSFTVIADDGNGGTATQSVTVNVADVTEGPVVPPTPTGGEVLTFDDLATDTVEAAVPEFGGVARDIVTVTEEDGSSRQMLSVTKADGADPWAGFEFISAYSASDLVGDGTQPVTMRVFADQAGTLTLGLEGDAPKIELSETVEAGWNNVVFDVSSAADADHSKAVMHIDFASGAATNTGAVTYLIDDVHFPQAVIVEAPVVATPEEAAPAFTADADDVAIFIDAASPGVNVNPGWGQRGSLLPETDAEAGEILKFSDLNYQGIDFGGSYDVSGKEHVRFDLWSETGGSVKVSAISPGAEKALDVTITGGEWNTVELDLADYSDVVDLTQVIQLKFDAQGLADGLNTFYMDNVAFAGTPAPVNTAPVFADATVVVDVDENETAVYVAQATDAEDTVSYTLGGDDAAAFEIAADGTVTFKVAPDYEVDPQSYSFTVIADDGNGGTATQSVTVNVADVTEGPVVPPTPTGGEVLTFDDLATDTVEAAVPEFGGVARDIVTVTEGRFKPSDAVCDEG